jgi:two-component system cell cycle sensor histidine kinase/response regulator CckA
MQDSHSILVVDDEPESLALLSSILAAEGYQVRSADSGKLAVASIAAWPPQLILLDIRMPGFDGFEVCRRLKASAETRRIPVIFLSASLEPGERVTGFTLGAVDYITKPFQREELLARVRTHLELGQLRARLETEVLQRTKELAATVERLRESEERFRHMADTAPVMIWVSDPNKLCTFFNEGWLTFVGRAIQQELGKGWAENVHPDDLDRCWDTYSSSFDARRSFQMEYRLRRADGEYRCLLDKGIPRFEPNGAFVGYIGSCLDITDLKSAHEEHLARQKMETVGTLASGIAHDFNNLLGGVLASAELALAELPEGSDPAKELQRIRDASVRGGEIVRQLMIYAGEDNEILDLVDVSGIVRDMLELLKVSVSKHVTVKTDLGDHLPAVRANPSQIRQVVMNLFTNASEAIADRDGVILVSTEPVRMSGGDYVQLKVSDSGKGMTLAVQARIFDPFFTTKPAGSHGIGLAGVKGIVQRLNGTIELSSTPGEGSTFRVFLRCEDRKVPATCVERARASESLGPRGLTILVVEDEHLLRHSVSAMLRRKGLSVLEASDGSTALEVIRAHKDELDVLLLDITLPGASSREVYEEARRLKPDLAVIVQSARSEETAATWLGNGIECFLRKPFSLADLIDKIRQVSPS